MSRTWREHDEALDEYRAAAQWYETKRPGWGGLFMDAVDEAIIAYAHERRRPGYWAQRVEA